MGGKRETSHWVKGPTGIYLEGIADNSLRMKTGIPLQRGDSYVPFVNFVSIFSPSKVKATSPPPWLRIYSRTLFSSCFSLQSLCGTLSSFPRPTKKSKASTAVLHYPLLAGVPWPRSIPTPLRLECASESPGGLGNLQTPGSHFPHSGSVEPSWSQIMFISHTFPGGVMLLVPGPTRSSPGLIQKARPPGLQDRHSAELFPAHLSK